MRVYTVGQERVFESIDRIIDNCPDGEESSIVSLCSRDVALRQRMKRNFAPDGKLSSTKVALREYGFIFEIDEDSRGPTEAELFECFLVDSESYRIMYDVEFANHLAIIYRIKPAKVMAQVRNLRHDFEMEVISKYVENTDPSLLFHERMPNALKSYIDKNFKSHNEFRKFFQIDYRLFEHFNRNHIMSMIQAGNVFEDLIENCYSSTELSVSTQVIFEDCRPDFVLDGEWVDAKLSKSTAFRGSKTIDKYTRHTDFLTLIYAIDDMPDDDIPELPDGVRLIHVFDYFKDIPPSLRNEIQTLIDAISTRKRKLVHHVC